MRWWIDCLVGWWVGALVDWLVCLVVVWYVGWLLVCGWVVRSDSLLLGGLVVWLVGELVG